MGKVAKFPHTEVYGRPVRNKDGTYRLHLGPRRRKPRGHPPLARGPRGKALLAVGQVWVENPHSMLWVVRSFCSGASHPSYPHIVELTPYYRGTYPRILTEFSLRHCMMVWEDQIEFVKGLSQKFEDAARNDPTSPWRGKRHAAIAAQAFCGLDAVGNRIRR